MEHAAGGSLAQTLLSPRLGASGSPVRVALARAVAAQLLAALAALHAEGLAHGHVCPATVLLRTSVVQAMGPVQVDVALSLWCVRSQGSGAGSAPIGPSRHAHPHPYPRLPLVLGGPSPRRGLRVVDGRLQAHEHATGVWGVGGRTPRPPPPPPAPPPPPRPTLDRPPPPHASPADTRTAATGSPRAVATAAARAGDAHAVGVVLHAILTGDSAPPSPCVPSPPAPAAPSVANLPLSPRRSVAAAPRCLRGRCRRPPPRRASSCRCCARTPRRA
jgi:hypothetical protein